jgi:hypothetical protein
MKAKPRILLIEDDVPLAGNLREALDTVLTHHLNDPMIR